MKRRRAALPFACATLALAVGAAGRSAHAVERQAAAGAPECVWTGRRIASLLWRDDIDARMRRCESARGTDARRPGRGPRQPRPGHRRHGCA